MMQFEIKMDEKFAGLVVAGLRKLPIEVAQTALEAFVGECNRQAAAQQQQEAENVEDTQDSEEAAQ